MRRFAGLLIPSIVFGISMAGAPGAALGQGVTVETGRGSATVFVPPQQPGQTPGRDPSQPTSPGTATLRGRVYASDTGQPLRRAQVRIISSAPPAAGQPPENKLVTTDASGRYEFTGLRGGRYTLNAQKGSYVSLQWGQQRPNEPGKPLQILDGQTIERVDFALPRGGVIAGRILDEFGDPLTDAQVSALRPQMVNGTRRLVNAGRTGPTNDIGEFRLFALPPGEYYVSALYRNQNPFGDSDDRSGYAPTYYPGTNDTAAAQKISVAVGQTINDITLTLLPTRTSRLSGTAVDSQNRPLRGTVQALPRTFVTGPLQLLPGQIRPDGSFTINGVTPGEYTLEVPPQGGPLGPTPAADVEYASLEVNVEGSDISGLRIVGTKPSTVAGRITIASGDGSSLRASTIRVGTTPLLTGGIVFGPVPQPVAVNDDWTFQIKARPGTSRVSTQGLQPPWSVKAVRYRGSDVTDTGIDIKANEDLGDLEIELTNRTTDLSGSVTNGRGDPVKDYWVVLFSRDREKWKPPSRSVRVGRADQDGRFKVTGLPPGAYLAIASATIDTSEVTDPDVLERLQREASRFAIGEGETKVLDLKLTTTP